MSRDIPIRDQKMLWGRSASRCAMPDCRRELVVERKMKPDPNSLVGQMAHIKGENEGAARYDASMTNKERDCYDNLILMCNVHHKVIDDQYNYYTVDRLQEMKNNHEIWVRDSTEEQVKNVSFAELNAVTKFLVVNQHAYFQNDFSITKLQDKIKKNELSPIMEHWITVGMLRVKQVDNYIEKNYDDEFGEHLRQGFVLEYNRLRNGEGLRTDELFNALWEFACGNAVDFKVKAAGLTVLVSLFEKCEVFEK